jgi:hypothetical protein
MKSKSVKTKIHIRLMPSSGPELPQDEIKKRLVDFFLLLHEIDQQNNVTKEYTNAPQAN